MNIFLSCQQSPKTYAIPAYGFWRGYFFAGLTEAGHHVIEDAEIDWAFGLTLLEEDARAEWRKRTWEHAVSSIRRLHETEGIDLFLSYLYPQQIDEQAIESVRDLGVPCVNFFCDHVREYRHLPDSFAPFDTHWVPEYAALELYQRREWPHVYAPMPCWIPPERRGLPSSEDGTVRFIGSHDDLRAGLLADVAGSGLPLDIRGAGWQPAASTTPAPSPAPVSWSTRLAAWRDMAKRQGLAAVFRRLTARVWPESPAPFDFSRWVKPQPREEADYHALLARCTVSLGINRFPSFAHSAEQLETYSRLRDIEAPMLGACYLTEWTDDIPQLYADGEEIETYRNAEELIAKARKLMRDAGRRRRLREAGQKRALAEHTVGKSVERIAKSLGLDWKTL